MESLSILIVFLFVTLNTMHESGFCSFEQHSHVKKSHFLKKIYFVFNCVTVVCIPQEARGIGSLGAEFTGGCESP